MKRTIDPTGGVVSGTVVLTHPTWTVDRLLVALGDLGVEVGEPGSWQRRVLDTADARVHHAGARVAVGNGALWLRDGSGATVRTAAPPDLRTAADLPPGPLRSRLADMTAGRALLPVVTFVASARGLQRRDKAGKAVVRGVMIDDIRVDGARVDGAVPGSGWMLELDPVTGYPRSLDDLVADLVRAGCARRVGDSIGVVAARVGVALHPPLLVVGRTLDPGAAASGAIRGVLVDLWTAVGANWEGTIAETDVEFLHDLRVALRRTRSVLGEIDDIVEADTLRHFRDEFRWLGSVTGRPRDLDVYIEEWPGYLAALGETTAAFLRPVLDHLAVHRRGAHCDLVDAMTGERARVLRDEWSAWLATPDPEVGDDGPAASGDPIGPMVAQWIRDAHARVVRDGRAIDGSSPAESLHALRKRAKRLRYLIECFAGVLPAKRRRTFVAELKELQENLGQHQDAEVHAAELRGIAIELNAVGSADTRADPPIAMQDHVVADTLMALGQLREQLRRRLCDTRAEFAGRFDAFDSPRVRSSLDALLRDLQQ